MRGKGYFPLRTENVVGKWGRSLQKYCCSPRACIGWRAHLGSSSSKKGWKEAGYLPVSPDFSFLCDMFHFQVAGTAWTCPCQSMAGNNRKTDARMLWTYGKNTFFLLGLWSYCVLGCFAVSDNWGWTLWPSHSHRPVIPRSQGGSHRKEGCLFPQ